MKIFVKARPNSREASVQKIDETNFIVSVKEPPVQGQANEAILRALAGYFGLPRANVRLVSGFSSKQKIMDINIAS